MTLPADDAGGSQPVAADCAAALALALAVALDEPPPRSRRGPAPAARVTGVEAPAVAPIARVLVISAEGDRRHRRTFRTLVEKYEDLGVEFIDWVPFATGEDRVETLRDVIESASVVVPLVTPELTASDRCVGVLARLMRDRADNPPAVLPIWVEPVGHLPKPLDRFDLLPADGPIMGRGIGTHAAWLSVLDALEEVLGKAYGSRSA